MDIKFKEKLKKLKEMHAVQGTDGNWNFDDYMRGLFNGLELALSLMEERPPEFKDHLIPIDTVQSKAVVIEQENVE